MTKLYPQSSVLRYLSIFLAAFLFVTSCSKDDVIPPPAAKSDKNDIVLFQFKKDYNSSLTASGFSYYSGNLIFVTLPEGSSLNALKPSFEVFFGYIIGEKIVIVPLKLKSFISSKIWQQNFISNIRSL